MIDYSVYMLTTSLKGKEATKAYARAQVSEIWTLEKFAKHIADHNGVYSRGTVKGVIADMCECLVEQLLNGNKIQLGELGEFSISISSEGADSLTEFSAKNIKSVNIIFTPGTDFENLINKADFNLVSSRVAQVATLKAEKAGEDAVDLAAAKKKATVVVTPSEGGSDSTSDGDAEDNTDNPGTESGGNTGTDTDNTGTESGGNTGEGSGNTGEDTGNSEIE